MHKKVLIITRCFYPYSSAGAHRCAKMVKYLPEYKWLPIVVCPDWQKQNAGEYYNPSLSANIDCAIIRVPVQSHAKNSIGDFSDRFLRKFSPGFYPLKLYWTMKACVERMPTNERVDAIIASSPPMMTLRIADKSSRERGIPWIADLRDIPDELTGKPWLVKATQVHAELSLCHTASAIVTVSEPIASILRARHRLPVYVIHNGFDSDDFPVVINPSNCFFTIVYGGLCYGERNPSPLFDALDLIIRRENISRVRKLRVRFYGDPPERLRPYFQGRLCAKLIEAMGRIPFGDMIKIEQQATVLLLLTHPKSKGIMTSKLFEYLGARRPILSIPGDNNVTDRLIRETRVGVIARTSEEVSRIILKWYDEWNETGGLSYKGQPEIVMPFSRKREAGRMAEILNQVCQTCQNNC